MPALQFESSSLVLVALIGLGVLSHNASITIAACVLLLCQQTALAQYLPWIQKRAYVKPLAKNAKGPKA